MSPGPQGNQVDKDRSRVPKPYSRPELIEYGPVQKLTQGGGATSVDGSGFKKGG